MGAVSQGRVQTAVDYNMSSFRIQDSIIVAADMDLLGLVAHNISSSP